MTTDSADAVVQEPDPHGDLRSEFHRELDEIREEWLGWPPG